MHCRRPGRRGPTPLRARAAQPLDRRPRHRDVPAAMPRRRLGDAHRRPVVRRAEPLAASAPVSREMPLPRLLCAGALLAAVAIAAARAPGQVPVAVSSQPRPSPTVSPSTGAKHERFVLAMTSRRATGVFASNTARVRRRGPRRERGVGVREQPRPGLSCPSCRRARARRTRPRSGRRRSGGLVPGRVSRNGDLHGGVCLPTGGHLPSAARLPDADAARRALLLPRALTARRHARGPDRERRQ